MTARENWMRWARDGATVRAFYGGGGPTVGVGRAVGLLEEPSIIIRSDDGTDMHWAARLCEELPDDEEETGGVVADRAHGVAGGGGAAGGARRPGDQDGEGSAVIAPDLAATMDKITLALCISTGSNNLDDREIATIARDVALALTPVPPLACPRCGVGRVVVSPVMAERSMTCVNGEGSGCGAQWDIGGDPR